jgi:hypothetical protein
MRLISAFLVIALLSASALAEPPKAVISGPTEVYPGDFIDLDATGSVADYYEWKVEPALFTDGRKSFRLDRGVEPQKSIGCQLASRSGTKFKVTLIVSKDNEGIATRDWEVVVLPSPGSTPPVVTTPVVVNTPPAQPGTPPVVVTTPPVSTPATVMGDWVRQNLNALVAADDRKTIQKMLGMSFKVYSVGGLAAQTPVAFAQYAANLNQQVFDAVPGSQTKWNAFMVELSKKLASANYSTVAEYASAWSGIGDALLTVP